MRETLVRRALERGGVLTRTEALEVVDSSTLGKAVKARCLLRPYPEVYVLADLADDLWVQDRAAIASVSGGGYSHTTGLRLWVIEHAAIDDRRHITDASNAVARQRPGLVIHRRRGFSPSHTRDRSGLAVVPVETAIVGSWPLLRPGDERGPAIRAVAGGKTTGERLLATLAGCSGAAGTSEMRQLFELLTLGCRSELELWGHQRVFDVGDLATALLQHQVATPAGLFILDRAYLAEKVGVELDGAAWHGSRVQRERDLRRDAALAAMGWLIVRFSHTRLHADPEGCRADLVRILESRRAR